MAIKPWLPTQKRHFTARHGHARLAWAYEFRSISPPLGFWIARNSRIRFRSGGKCHERNQQDAYRSGAGVAGNHISGNSAYPLSTFRPNFRPPARKFKFGVKATER